MCPKSFFDTCGHGPMPRIPSLKDTTVTGVVCERPKPQSSQRLVTLSSHSQRTAEVLRNGVKLPRYNSELIWHIGDHFTGQASATVVVESQVCTIRRSVHKLRDMFPKSPLLIHKSESLEVTHHRGALVIKFAGLLSSAHVHGVCSTKSVLYRTIQNKK